MRVHWLVLELHRAQRERNVNAAAGASSTCDTLLCVFVSFAPNVTSAALIAYSHSGLFWYKLLVLLQPLVERTGVWTRALVNCAL